MSRLGGEVREGKILADDEVRLHIGADVMLSGIDRDGEDRVIFICADPCAVQSDLDGEVLAVGELSAILDEIDGGFAGGGVCLGDRVLRFMRGEGGLSGAAGGGQILVRTLRERGSGQKQAERKGFHGARHDIMMVYRTAC